MNEGVSDGVRKFTIQSKISVAVIEPMAGEFTQQNRLES